MSDLQILLQTNGPLPQSAVFKAPASGPATIYVSGSVWTQTAGSAIGIMVSIDGAEVGSAWVYANAAGTHIGVVPVFMPITLPDSMGSHKVTIAAINAATTTDLNDNFQVALLL